LPKFAENIDEYANIIGLEGFRLNYFTLKYYRVTDTGNAAAALFT